MGFKKVIQLNKLKDKTDKRYKAKINFYQNNNFVSSSIFDIHDIITKNSWKKISFAESMLIFKHLFDIDTGHYPIEKNNNQFWCIKEVDGWSVCFTNEDLSKIRHNKLLKLGI